MTSTSPPNSSSSSSSNNNNNTISIGSTIRVPITNNTNTTTKPNTTRAIIATIDNDDQTATIFCESRHLIPHPVVTITAKHTAVVDKTSGGRRERGRPLQRSFLLCPPIFSQTNPTKDEDEERVVPLSILSPLLPFEIISSSSDENKTSSSSSSSNHERARQEKANGDALFLLKDYVTAIERYEMALSMTSLLSVGGTVVIRRMVVEMVQGKKGRRQRKRERLVVAMVDCCDDDDVELTLGGDDDEEEVTMTEDDIVLCLSCHNNDDDDDMLQERIILQLSKCFCHLATLTTATDGNDIQRRYRGDYHNACVTGVTLVLLLLSHRRRQQQQQDTMPSSSSSSVISSMERTARHIRIRTNLDHNQIKQADADIQWLLKRYPNDAAATKLEREMKRREVSLTKANKFLAKEMCRWVEHATTTTATDGGGDDGERMEEDNRIVRRQEMTTTTSGALFTNLGNGSRMIYSIAVVVAIAIVFHFILS